MPKMHPIVGGPLDGKRGNLKSFRPPDYEQKLNPNQPYYPLKPWDNGVPRPCLLDDETRPIPGTGGEFFQYRDEYVGYNRSGNSWWVRGAASFVFFHTSLVPGT